MEFQSSNPQEVAQKALALVDTILGAAYTSAGLVVTIISSTGTIIVTTSDGSGGGGGGGGGTTYTCPAADASNFPCNKFGGVCVSSGTSFACFCKDGYSAALCSTCASGYVAVEGSGKDVRCVKQSSTCSGLPTAVANGTWPSSCSNAAVGITCTGTCATGLSGSPTATCLSTGVWSQVTGSCNPLVALSSGTGCLYIDLPYLANGMWPTACDNFGFGATCTGSCVAGFSGSPSVICAGGIWSSVTGDCLST